MTATYQTRGDVAVITLDNPPVNGLGHATRLGIVQGLEQALADAAIQAIVITGAGKAFSGGADIREFGSPKALAEPNLLSVIAALEASTKPIVAALHSVVMGGGLELALGCHYRVAAPRAQLGLPEVKLGILPGSGGTQRLPRVIPMAEALRMMTTGNPIPAEKAKELNVPCDAVHAKDRHPAEGIIETAQAQMCDLIVMASHDRRGLARLLIGSQANKVVTLSPVPVLICR